MNRSKQGIDRGFAPRSDYLRQQQEEEGEREEQGRSLEARHTAGRGVAARRRTGRRQIAGGAPVVEETLHRRGPRGFGVAVLPGPVFVARKALLDSFHYGLASFLRSRDGRAVRS